MTKVIIFLTFFFSYKNIWSRSPLHITNSNTPIITTQWHINNKKLNQNFTSKVYTFSNKTITYFPLFEIFNFKEMQNYKLPEGPITYRNNPKMNIDGNFLTKMIEKFFNEVLDKKKTYTDFIVLKKADFNLNKQAGLLIVKAKNYPFVVKLFMETPRSFLRPHNKGLISLLQFGINGGATRHLVGFTRIKNSHTIIDLIKKYGWEDKVDVPRKWYWSPSNYPRIFITAKNFEQDDPLQSILLPGAYAIITDYIESDGTFSLSSCLDRKDALAISNALECRIDPHINNFLREKNTGKIIIIDTEHFPTLVGLEKALFVKSYSQLYFDLALTYLHRNLFLLKKDRILRQSSYRKPFCKP